MDQGGPPVDEELVGLFDLSHDAFCVAGFDGYLRRANPAFARSLGYTLDELLARPFMDNVYPDDVESVEALLAALAFFLPRKAATPRHQSVPVRSPGSRMATNPSA
jgi:PAS domain S-box-containing protein